MFTPSTIKAIQDIMRQDIGVDGDATRLSQMVWLIFLKILDDEDKALEIRKEKFAPTLPKKYQWSTWAGPLDGITGDKLIEFVNNDLLPGLRELPKSSNKRTELTRMAFQDVYNFMRKGTLLKQVINKINEIDFNASKDRHAFNEIYERLLKSLQSAGNFGEMYTPRAVTQFIVEMVDPKIGESVLDPAVGTGGFLVHSLEHMRKQVKSVKDEQKIQQSIHGVEKKPLPFMLLITNMMLHGIEEPVTMRRGNTLERPLREYTDADKVSCVVTNPPFGGTEEPGIESNFPKEFQTRETADLFLVLIMRLLKKNGRAGIVLPDGTLYGEGMKTAIKKLLLEECNLHTIVRLPMNVFAPYTSIATNLLFFTKGETTKEVWYYEHSYPEGRTSYSTSNPISIKEFDTEKQWWNKREENLHAWKVSIDQIKARNYNLDIKNPNALTKIFKSPAESLSEYREKQDKIKTQLSKIKKFIDANFSHIKLDKEDDLLLVAENLYDFIQIPDGVGRLEKIILEYAASGKFTHQDPSEGTGDKLYSQIKKEQESQLPTRKKKVKYHELITEDEIPFEIPTSWRWVRLGNTGRTETGSTPRQSGSRFDGGDIPFVRPDNINSLSISSVKDYLTESDLKNGGTLVPKGSLLMVCIGTIGKVGVAYQEVSFNQQINAISPYKGVSVEYLLYTTASEYFQSRAWGLSSKTTLSILNKTKWESIPIPLPPLAEQKRIVKKVEEVMTLVGELKKLLA